MANIVLDVDVPVENVSAFRVLLNVPITNALAVEVDVGVDIPVPSVAAGLAPMIWNGAVAAVLRANS